MTLWKKHYPLTDKNAFICLVDHMGDDSSIVQAARVSYGKDKINDISIRAELFSKHFGEDLIDYHAKESGSIIGIKYYADGTTKEVLETDKEIKVWQNLPNYFKDRRDKDRQLIRYLMNHSHTTPFEMVEIKFMVQVPMDCWRQWIRHRTASVNEYSTRYTEALDFFQVTDPSEWRLQSTDNKQGSSGFLEEWPEGTKFTLESETEIYVKDTTGFVANIGVEEIWGVNPSRNPGEFLSHSETAFHQQARIVYEDRLALGIAKEQARKDLPLSTYTRAYWKCDLHNIFNFLRLRMDSHAQIEIRSFANCMFDIIKEICPVACEAFEDYVLHAKRFSRMEMECLRGIVNAHKDTYEGTQQDLNNWPKQPQMTDREWKEFLIKIG